MKYIQDAISRYKHLRSLRLLRQTYEGKYAFVGIGSHSTDNLYPVLHYLHVPLKNICCKSPDKLRWIERAFPHVVATTSLQDVLDDEEVKGVLVSVSPQAHFALAAAVIRSGKALFIEKPPCQSQAELSELINLRRSAGLPTVVVGLQKRRAPAMKILRKALEKRLGEASYNLRYLTGAYPEGDALLDLFIHPLDCAVFLFGKAEVKWVEPVGNHTLLITLQHANAHGLLELSTGYSWQNARESLTINTPRGVFELEQMERLTFQDKQSSLLGVPLEKVFPRRMATTELFNRSGFVPTLANNPVFTQGYFDTLQSFIRAAEGEKVSDIQSLEALSDTYSLLEDVRSFVRRR